MSATYRRQNLNDFLMILIRQFFRSESLKVQVQTKYTIQNLVLIGFDSSIQILPQAHLEHENRY